MVFLPLEHFCAEEYKYGNEGLALVRRLVRLASSNLYTLERFSPRLAFVWRKGADKLDIENEITSVIQHWRNEPHHSNMQSKCKMKALQTHTHTHTHTRYAALSVNPFRVFLLPLPAPQHATAITLSIIHTLAGRNKHINDDTEGKGKRSFDHFVVRLR